MNAPRGINLMWNTSLLLPGILLAPVTVLAGPQVSLTILLTLGIAGSAAGLFWVLRRWGASLGAAALGGAVYGFSPALLNSGIGHYHLQFAVLPPLIIDAAAADLTGRGRAVADRRLARPAGRRADVHRRGTAGRHGPGRPGAGGRCSRPAIRGPCADRARDVAFGLGISATVALLICGYAAVDAVPGPLAEHNSPGRPVREQARLLRDPSGDLLLHTPASAAAAAAYSRGLPEYLGYLGWPLLVVLVAAAIRYWRDPRVRAAAVTWAVLEVLSLGGGAMPAAGSLPGSLLPFHWLQGLPVLSQVLPDRLAILADGAAGAVLAFSLDRARSAAPQARAWRRARPRRGRGAGGAAADPAAVPDGAGRGDPGRLAGGLRPAAARAGRPRARRPGPLQRLTEAMRWQADTGEPGVDDRRLLPRARPAGQQAIYIPGPTRPRRSISISLGRGAAPPLPRGLIRRRICVLAARRRGRGHQPGLAAGALPDRAVRAAHVRGRRACSRGGCRRGSPGARDRAVSAAGRRRRVRSPVPAIGVIGPRHQS